MSLLIHKKEKIKYILNLLDDENLYPSFHKFTSCSTDPELKISGDNYLMFSSNNYLGLATDRRIIEASKKQLGDHGIGPGGSRLLCGNLEILEELEKQIACFVGKQDAITFPTGYMANMSIFYALMDPFFIDQQTESQKGVIFSDELNHATIIDGCRFSSANKIIFRHNDIEELEKKIYEYRNIDNKLIVTEGVFTLEGDIGRIQEISTIAKKYNCMVMVDDAHGIGIMGTGGSGTVSLLGQQENVDIIMGSFDKAIGGMGGFLAGDTNIIKFLRIASRPYIFSSALSAVLAGGIMESIKICKSDEGEELRKGLFRNANYVREQLKVLGYKILGDGSIPVVPVYIGEEKLAIKFEKKLFEYRIFAPCFRWPAVSEGNARIRVTIMSSHSKEHLDSLLQAFELIGKGLDII